MAFIVVSPVINAMTSDWQTERLMVGLYEAVVSTLAL